MNTLLQDFRFALRQLRRAPGFALTAILTLALGIGANTAIFSLLDQALLRSLPVQKPSELVVLRSSTDTWEGSTSVFGGDSNDYFSYPAYKYLRDNNHVFSGALATTPSNAGFSRGNSSQVINTELVSGNYFSVLGVAPALGRLLTAADDTADNSNPVVVLSYDFWRNQLAADPHVVGSTVNLNGHPLVVIGIAAPGFHSAVWGQTPSAFVPMSMRDSTTGHFYPLTDHTARWLNIIARLSPGTTAAAAQAGIAPLWHALRTDEYNLLGKKGKRFTAGFLTDNRLLLKPGARGYSYSRSNLEAPFLAVMGMAVLVLLISSVNVASLLLVRGATRVREFALRSALGAPGSRLLAQLLQEGLLIGVLGGAFGLLLAPVALRVLVARLSTPDSESPWSTSLDTRVLLFNFAIALLVALFFSFAPALQLRRLNLVTNLREGSSTGAGSLLTLRRVIVCLQIGLSVILLVASGLFLRTMQHLRAVDVGFNTAHLASFDLDPTLAGYTEAQIPALQKRVLSALAALPGVSGVAATNDTELASNQATANFSVAGYVTPPEDSFVVEVPAVTPDYFAVMGMPLVAGRSLNDSDDLTHPRVTVINESFAKHFCGSVGGCLGRMVGTGAGNVKLDTQIVGVVRDAHHYSIRKPAIATSYTSIFQLQHPGDLNYYLRNYGDTTATLAAARSALRSIDPGLAPTALTDMTGQIDTNLSNERMITLLATAFGALATLLAGVGLYGVLAYSTTQRTREIGIRMALGSTRLGVSRLILSDVLRLAAIGLVIALPVAFTLAHFIRAQLFGVSTFDPVILLSVIAVVALVCFLAGLLPARRAASINPNVALRTD